MNCIRRAVVFSFLCFSRIRSGHGFVALFRHGDLTRRAATTPAQVLLAPPLRVRQATMEMHGMLPSYPAPSTKGGNSSFAAPPLSLSSGGTEAFGSNASRKRTYKRPDPSTLLSSKGRVAQRIGFAKIVAVLGLGTMLLVRALTLLQAALPLGWFNAFRYYTGTLTMGAFYLFVGVTHFAFPDTYAAFVPPAGTWGGLWRVPAPGAKILGLTDEAYHNYWTGLVEIVGGGLLVLSGFPFNLAAVPTSVPALLLFLLTCAVTPANIYMYTHDIRPPRMPQDTPYPASHYFRGFMQCLFLSTLWKLAFP
jgi:uncharacterized membrane protein